LSNKWISIQIKIRTRFSDIYRSGLEPDPPIQLDEMRTLFNLMRLPDKFKADYKKNVISGMKESPIFQNKDPKTQEQFLKNIYFFNDNKDK
jgi:hypothetical protein